MSNFEEDTLYYKFLVFKSKSPISISMTLGCDADVIELRSHDTDEDAFIVKLDQKIVQQKVVVEASSAKKMWSIVQDDGLINQLTRCSTSSESSVKNESLSNDNGMVNDSVSFSRDESERHCGNDIVQRNSSLFTESATATPIDPSTHNLIKPTSNSDTSILMIIEFALGIIKLLKDPNSSKITSFTFIHDHIQQILSSEAFMGLSLECLKKIMSTQREDPILEFAFAKSLAKWSEQFDERQSKLPFLFKMINLQYLKIEQLIELSEMPLIRRNLECRDIIDRAKNDLLISFSRSKSPLNEMVSSPSSSLNKVTGKSECDSRENDKPKIIEEELKSGESNSYFYVLLKTEQCIKRLNLKSGDCETITTYQRSNSDEDLVASNDSDYLYIIQNKKISVYNMKRKSWTSMRVISKFSKIISKCIHNHCLYYLCKDSTTSFFECFKYDPSSTKLQQIMKSSTPQLADKIIPYNNSIFFVKSATMYVPASTMVKSCNYFIGNSWFSHTELKNANRFVYDSMIVVNDEIIFYHNGTIKCLHPKTGLRVHSKLPHFLDHVSCKISKMVKLMYIDSKLYLIQEFGSDNNFRVSHYDGNQWIGGPLLGV